MNDTGTPFNQFQAIMKTYPKWLGLTYLGFALAGLIGPYLLPAGLLESLGPVLIPVLFLCLLATASFIWLIIAEIVVRVLNRWCASRLNEAKDG